MVQKTRNLVAALLGAALSLGLTLMSCVISSETGDVKTSGSSDPYGYDPYDYYSYRGTESDAAFVFEE
jgi:hypothetical protein